MLSDVGLDCFYYISVYPGYGVEIKVSDLDLAGAKLGLACYLSRKVPAVEGGGDVQSHQLGGVPRARAGSWA